jgi:hypothetical protein
MTQRRRFLGTLLGLDTDRFPYFDLEPDEATVSLWHREGLPRLSSFSEYFNIETHYTVGPMLRSYPFYRKAPDILCILCTTGGNLSPLLPSLIDAGINGLWISNIRSAGMEYATLRREYGSEVALIGGIDATALTRDEAAVRKAVEQTVPPLLEGGHYLPCLDDRPRSNLPFSHYKLYRHILEETIFALK